MIRTRTRTRTQPRQWRLIPLLSLLLAIGGLTVLAGSPASAADVGYKGPYYGQAAGTTGGSVPGSPTAQKPQSKLWFAHGSWWGALWNETSTNTAEAFTIQRYDWGGNRWVDTGVKLETRARSDLDVLWDGGHLYVASNSDAPTIATQSVEVSRYAYSGGTWTLDWTVPVAGDYVYSPVIEKDSTGMLWMTYTKGDKVMVAHSAAGNEQSWVTPYVLPTPAGQSTISHDPAADPNQASSDIASIVSYDGNKIGVLWSNQSRDTVYWASHTDGAPEGQWSTEVAFTAPEGADDHLSLKSVVGTDGGRVYAVTKTSMNGEEPIFEVLVLRLNGVWDSFPYASASTNLTRPIIVLDTGNRELYVFASAGETASSGGVIYYKKTSMTSPDFGSLSSRGTVFISDDTLTDADPTNTRRINNPASTKQNLNASTGLLVVANNDPTDYYYYNRMSLTDGTAPDTTITAQPAASTTETTAAFSFTSNEPGSTFECKLDTGTYAACTSPKSYSGLALGSHTFSVRAKDATNTDATPASYTWSVVALDTTAPDTTITGQPAASTTKTTAEFSFTANEPGSSFECSLDAGAYAACTSPKSYSGLALGSHTFAVRAKDVAGNPEATSDSYTWSVVALDTTITGQPAASTTATDATFSFTSNEPGSTFECKLDTGTYAACTSPKSYSGLAATSHTFAVRAKDGTNTDATPASYTWSVVPPAPPPSGGGGGGGGGSTPDTTALDTTITAKPASSTVATTADFSFTANEAGSTFECKLDAGSYAACSSPKSYTGLAVGQHTFAVRAKDAAGSTDASPASYTWTVTTATQSQTATRLFADDFSSGDFASGAWRVSTRKADALVMDGALRSGDDGAVLRTRSLLRSHATLSKTLGSQHRSLRVEWTALVNRDGGDGRLSRLIRIRDNSGRVVLTLLRAAGNGRLQVKDLHGTVTTAGRLPLDRVRELVLVLEQRRGRDVWKLSLNGKVVAANAAARTGGRALRGVTFGSSTGGLLDYRIDNVEVWAP